MTVRWRYLWFGLVLVLGAINGLNVVHAIAVNDAPWDAFSRAFVGLGALFIVEGAYQNVMRARSVAALAQEVIAEIAKAQEVIQKQQTATEDFLHAIRGEKP